MEVTLSNQPMFFSRDNGILGIETLLALAHVAMVPIDNKPLRRLKFTIFVIKNVTFPPKKSHVPFSNVR